MPRRNSKGRSRKARRIQPGRLIKIDAGWVASQNLKRLVKENEDLPGVARIDRISALTGMSYIEIKERLGDA